MGTLSFSHNRGAKIDCQNSQGRTAVHYAAMMGHAAVLKELISAKANTAILDADGAHAIHFAAAYSRLNTLEIILEAKDAPVELEDKNGNTPLLYAVKKNSPDIVRSLIEKGRADPMLPCKNGIPIAIAIQNKQWGCVIHMLMAMPADKIKSHFLTLLNDRAIKQEIAQAFFHFVKKLPLDEEAQRVKNVLQQKNMLGVLLSTPDIPLLNISYFKKPAVIEEVKKFGMERKYIK